MPEHPGVLKDRAKVRDSWNGVYRGTGNAHNVAVLEEGMKYRQSGIPPEEVLFLETRKFQLDEIARLYRIPSHISPATVTSSFVQKLKPHEPVNKVPAVSLENRLALLIH